MFDESIKSPDERPSIDLREKLHEPMEHLSQADRPSF